MISPITNADDYALFLAASAAAIKIGMNISNCTKSGHCLGDFSSIVSSAKVLKMADEKHCTVSEFFSGISDILPKSTVDELSMNIMIDKLVHELIIIACCHSVKPLKVKNVTNRLIQKSSSYDSATVHSITTLLSTGTSTRVILEDVLMHRDTDPWIKFHTTAVSTPGVVMKLAEDFRNLGIISDRIFMDIEGASRNSHDRSMSDKIPQGVIGITVAFLTSCNRLPDNWYQGIKARDEMSPATWKIAVALGKSYFRLTADTSDIDTAVDLAELKKIISATPALVFS